ncbi:MAG: Ig-like domain-containing protein, partial [bacterium]
MYRGLGAFGVEVTEVHVRLTAVTGSTRDTTISFPPGQDTLVVDIPIPPSENDQPFTALLELRNDQHVVLFSGTQTVIARSATLPRFSSPAVLIQYTGPGTKAKTVTVSPPDTTGAATIPLRASAVDSSGDAVADLLVRWTTSDATIATLTPTSSVTATVAGLGRRGSATISAITPSGITGSARVTVVPPPARVVLISGGAQTGIAGSVLALPVVVEVQATDNLPVPGTPVTFRAVTAGGNVTTASAVTDAQGRASSTMSLGRAGGTYQYEVTSGALTPLSVSEVATAPTPSAFSLVSGDQQVDSVGRSLTLPLVVSVLDQFGRSLSGTVVTWTTMSGTGAASSASTTTGSDGRASTTYRLGNAVGTETVNATAAGLTGGAGTVSFTMRAISRGAAAVAIIAGGDQSVAPGTTAPTPLVAQVVDAIGNPVANASVTWSAAAGNASFSAASSLTDATGYVATRITLGSTAGPVVVTARAGAPTASTTLNVVAGPAAILSRVSGDAQTAHAGTSVAVAPSVIVTDVGGNPVQGAAVTFAVSSGGGSATAATTSTNAAGVATVGSWTLGTLAGTNTL